MLLELGFLGIKMLGAGMGASGRGTQHMMYFTSYPLGNIVCKGKGQLFLFLQDKFSASMIYSWKKNLKEYIIVIQKCNYQ